jgi:hypothetical protein
MESDLECIAALRTLEIRALHRPCSASGLLRLNHDLEARLTEFRQQREVWRSTTDIPTESYALRTATHAARIAISNSLASHARAQTEVSRLQDLVRRGHARSVELLELLDSAGAEFSDLQLSFSKESVCRKQILERRILISVLFATGIAIVTSCLIELWRHSSTKLP